MKKYLPIFLLYTLVFLTPLVAATFPSVEGIRFDKKKFLFPDDLLEGQPIIIALTLSKSRENGEQQQQALIEWHPYLLLHTQATVHHIAVIDNAPFFVRGAIRKGIAETYADTIEADKGGVLFTDADTLSSQAAIPIDGEPTLVVVDAAKTIVGTIKGSYTQERLEALEAILYSIR